MPEQVPVFSPFLLPKDDPDFRGSRRDGRGRRPVMFDILAPDRQTSILDLVESGLRMVLHVNPRSMRLSYAKQTQRIQVRSGFVEFHWGDAAEEITFDAATGGFMRMFAGLSNITAYGAGDQSRRETIAYDKYLDLLALFHNNGAIYDAFGNIAEQGYIKMTFDGGSHTGWFDGQFTVTEDANTPYMFNMSARFIIDREEMRFRSANLSNVANAATIIPAIPTATLVEQAGDVFAATARAAPATSILDPAIRVGKLQKSNIIGRGEATSNTVIPSIFEEGG